MRKKVVRNEINLKMTMTKDELLNSFVSEDEETMDDEDVDETGEDESIDDDTDDSNEEA